MRHRRIGATDLVASEVGLAVGPLVSGPGARPDDEVADLIAAAPAGPAPQMIRSQIVGTGALGGPWGERAPPTWTRVQGECNPPR